MSSDCKISIVILTKNAGPAFRQTLDQISAQTVDGDFELIIVDSGSSDGIVELLNNYPARLYTIRPDEFNFGLTRNYGFSLAKGEYIVTLSQDVTLSNQHWLANIIKPFQDNEMIAAVQGVICSSVNEDVFYWERNGLFYFTSETAKWMSKYKIGLSFVCCAIRRSIWEQNQIGYTPFSEDKLFQMKIHNKGYQVVVARDAVCYHGHQYNFNSLRTRLLGEGMGWRYVGLRYTFKECLEDIIRNKWLIRKSFQAFFKRELNSMTELFFPLLRPILIYKGNRISNDASVKSI